MQRLRDLPKIIILDLSGNPCTAGPGDDYRLYVIYNVRKLKVGGCGAVEEGGGMSVGLRQLGPLFEVVHCLLCLRRGAAMKCKLQGF